jgi:phosphatidylinositol-3-phosphatase
MGPTDRLPRRLLAAGAVIAAVALAGISGCAAQAPPRSVASSQPSSPSRTFAPGGTSTRALAPASAGLPKPDHVVIVVEENKDYDAIASLPYFSALGREGTVMTDSHGIAHPSQPNYLALWSGSTHGVTTNDCPQDFGTGKSLGGQLLEGGYSVQGFMDSMAADGSTDCKTGGVYARKHNPLADWAATKDAAHDTTFASWPADYSRLPTVSLVVPDLCHDMHDCSTSTGDAWLKSNLDGYAQWAKTHNSVLVVTFDEDSKTTTANHVYTVLVGEHIRAGATSGQAITHYNVLATIERAYGLPLLTTAAPITGIYR